MRPRGFARLVLGAAIEFLVEDRCVLCRRSHPARDREFAGLSEPARGLLEPVVLPLLGGALAVRNRPVCGLCAGEFVTARSGGVLGRRVGRWGIETEIGGIFGEPTGAPAGGNAGEKCGESAGGGPGEALEGARIRVLAPFMTTNLALEIVRQLKFGGYLALVEPVARAMAWAVRNFASEWEDAPLLVPVPMDRGALRRRGFNPSERLARRLSIELGCPAADVLRKVARTRPQSKTPAERRAANVRNAFACGEKALPPGRAAVLVDDLVTTGATSAACGTALLRAGARSVTVVCFGRAM